MNIDDDLRSNTKVFKGRTIMIQTISEKIQQRRYQMLVHSYLYYQLNTGIITDSTFDRWAKELVYLQDKYPEEARKARYHAEFKGFDGSSGYDLPYKMPNIRATAERLLGWEWDGYNER